MAKHQLTILSLFDSSGNWAKPWAEAGFNCVCIDLFHGVNVMDIDQSYIDYWQNKYGPIIGVLAAPPCTHFAGSGAQYWLAKDMSGKTAEAVELVRHTLWIIDQIKPVFWALENPVGRISKLVPELGTPWYWQPHWFGDAWAKKTGLWGDFISPTQDTSPTYWNNVKPGLPWIHQKLGGKSENTKAMRSKTPIGFAYAFAEAQGAFHGCS